MSHNTMIDNVKITDVDALRSAVEELRKEGANITLDENGKHFRTWPGQPTNCDMVLRMPDEKFDVGFRKNDAGEYTPIFDHMLDANKSIACDISHRGKLPFADRDRATIGKLMQRYTVCLTEKEMALQGYMCNREFDKTTGEMHVVATL